MGTDFVGDDRGGPPESWAAPFRKALCLWGRLNRVGSGILSGQSDSPPIFRAGRFTWHPARMPRGSFPRFPPRPE